MGLSNSTASHAEPFEPGKGSTGSFEGGNTGGRAPKALPHACMSAQPSVQPPAGRNEALPIQRLQPVFKENRRMKAWNRIKVGGQSPAALSHLLGFVGNQAQLCGYIGFRSMMPVCGA